MRGLQLICLMSIYGILYSFFLRPAEAEDMDRRMVRALGIGNGAYFSRQTIPSAPLEVSRPIAEWEPAAFVWVNLSIGRALQEPEVLAFYREFVSVVSEFVPVVVGWDFAEIRYWARFERQFFKEDSFTGRRDRVRFFDSKCESLWTRDFGPHFARGSDGGIVFIDTIYREAQNELSAFADKRGDLENYTLDQNIEMYRAFRQNARRAEVLPLVLARYSRGLLEMPVDISRPGMVLHGGDYLSDGDTRVFISEDTLMVNGGREEVLAARFRDYFGAKELHVLQALPGRAVRHQDFCWKLLSRNQAVVTSAPRASVGGSRFSVALRAKAGKLLEDNVTYLQQVCPDIELIEIPMPAVLQDAREDVVLKLWGRIVSAVCKEVGVRLDSYWYSEAPGPDYAEVKLKVEGRMREILGHAPEFKREADLDTLLIRYFGDGLEGQIRNYFEESTIYRSYANSVVVNAGEAGMVLLLPRYRPAKGESQVDFDQMEREVETAYSKVYPNSAIRWIDSDVMAKRGGALHCISMTVPLP